MIFLAAIAKNEARCIGRMLESAAPFVDYVVIADTGSTDQTPAVVRDTMAKLGRAGDLELLHHPFLDFAHNRNLVIKAVRDLLAGPLCARAGMGPHWLLTLDADEEVFGSAPDLFRNLQATAPGYEIARLQMPEMMPLPMLRLVNLAHDWRYTARCHEFISAPVSSDSSRPVVVPGTAPLPVGWAEQFRKPGWTAWRERHMAIPPVLSKETVPLLDGVSIKHRQPSARCPGKERLYLDLLMRDYAEDPANARTAVLLAGTHCSLGVELYEQFKELMPPKSPDLPWVRAMFARLLGENPVGYCLTTYDLAPAYLEPLRTAALWLIEQEQFHAALVLTSFACAQSTYNSRYTDPEIVQWELPLLHATACRKARRYAEAAAVLKPLLNKPGPAKFRNTASALFGRVTADLEQSQAKAHTVLAPRTP